MDDGQFKEIEDFATEITRKSGAILLDHFQKPMDVEFKSENQTNPVTDADKRSEEYLKEAILRQYPDHAILAEEGSQVESETSDFTWVVDPLDGTVNFLNGLPIFGVSVGVLYQGHPIVGCIFVPSPRSSTGNVFHARQGGGAFCDDEPIQVSEDSQPKRSRISIFPNYYARTFSLKKGFRGQVGELRSPGSVAYELALTASGVIQFAIFVKPWVWDVAAGIVLVSESRGVALVRWPKQRQWDAFRAFTTEQGMRLSLEELKGWRTSWLFGNPEMTSFVDRHMTPRSRLGLVAAHRLRDWLY